MSKRTGANVENMKTQDQDDDNDLADLLGVPAPTTPASGSYAKQQERVYQSYYERHPSMNFCNYISAYISVCCYYHPVFCSFLALGAGFVLLLVLVSLVLNPMEQFGLTPDQVRYYATQVHSKYDLSISQIDHWCLAGGNSQCPYCEDPLVPLSRNEHKSWSVAFNKNKKIVQKYVDDPLLNAELDVAFLGGSIVEEMTGRWMGTSHPNNGTASDLQILARVFNSNFQHHSKNIRGVALGIAGDASPNVLFRILHGEMPEGFDPRVWWIHVGMNDLGRMHCSEQVTVIGILRIVEEILERKPRARIVLNSLFPMAMLREGDYPVLSDYKDSFERPRGVASRHVAPNNDDGRRRLRAASDQNVNLKDNDHQLSWRGRTNRFRRNAHGWPATRVRMLQETEDVNEPDTNDPEERTRDRQAHRIRERLNPTLSSDQTKIRKFRPGYFGKRRLPLWTSIRHINKELHDFAANTPRVYFFDSTFLFVSSDESRKTARLMSDRISARGHPTEQGYRLWESAAVDRLQQIIDTMKIEDPDLFATDDVPENVANLDDDADMDEFGTLLDDVVPLNDDAGNGDNENTDEDTGDTKIDRENYQGAENDMSQASPDDDKYTVDPEHRGDAAALDARESDAAELDAETVTNESDPKDRIDEGSPIGEEPAANELDVTNEQVESQNEGEQEMEPADGGADGGADTDTQESPSNEPWQETNDEPEGATQLVDVAADPDGGGLDQQEGQVRTQQENSSEVTASNEDSVGAGATDPSGGTGEAEPLDAV